MKKNSIKTRTLLVILEARQFLPLNKIFVFFFLLLKFTGIIISANSVEHHHDSTIDTYHLFQYLTYYNDLS